MYKRQVEYANPTGRADIAFAIENIVMHINNIHKIEGVSLVNPSDILAKLFATIPKKIPIPKKKYPNKGFILIITE